METEVIKIIAQKLNELNGIECYLIDPNIQFKNQLMDAEIVLRHNNFEERYFIEVKKKIVPSDVLRILEQNKDVTKRIYFAEYITPKAKEILRINNVPHVDTAGNIFLNTDNMYIQIQTDETNRKQLKTHTKAFNKAGLKVIYQFLVNPDYINMPYRFIGDKATVTIATVGTVFKDLLKEKYIIQRSNRDYEFQNREKLFEEWVREYNRNLRPKLKTKRYKWLNKNLTWRNLKLPKETFWGGTNAAELLTNYLIADKMQIYTALEFNEIMKALKIIPDKDGDLIITETFWKNQEEQKLMVDPILVYADLLNDPNPRYMETANKIYKEHVQDNL